MKMNKKGIELSINFIVILIISIIIFTGSIYMTKKFFSKAEEIRKDLDSGTEDQIYSLLSDGSKVAIPVSRKDIKRGKSDVFGLGIYNVLKDEATFEVMIVFSKAYDRDETVILNSNQGDYINEKWIFSDARQYTLQNNEKVAVPILVKVDGKITEDVATKKGTYIFNVCVCKDSCGGSCNSMTPMYGDSMHKIRVTVP